MPPEDDVLPAEEQPLPAAISPTADSPGYILEFDHEEDPKEDDKDPKEDPADYLTDRDNDDDEEEEMSVRAQTPISLPSETKVARLLVIPTPLPSPLSPLSSPLPQILSPLPQILSPPLPISPPPIPASPTYPLGYRAAMMRLRAKSPSTSHPLPPIILPHTMASVAMLRAAAPSTYILTPRPETPPSGTLPLLPITLPASSLPLLLPSTYCRVNVREVTLPPRKRLRIALGPRFEVVRVHLFLLLDLLKASEQTMDLLALWMMRLGETSRERRDTDEIYRRLDDAHDDRLLMSGQLNMLRRDRRAHARTARLMESEARISREAWVQSMDASDMACAKHCRDVKDPLEVQHILRKWHQKGPPDQHQPQQQPPPPLSRNGKDNHDSRTGVRRQAPPARECTYQDFMICKPLYFKGTEGVELALMCARMFLGESDTIERYISGFLNMIQRSVMASKPKTMQDTIEFTTELMGKKISTFAERQAENKRKFEVTSKNNLHQQQNRKQNNGKAYTAGSGDKKPYGCSKPLCSKCNYHHDGQKPTCFECEAQGHFKRKCPKLKNNNRGNQGVNGNAPAKVYTVSHAGINPNSNVVTSVSQIDITSTTLDHYYDVELADGRIIGLNTIIRGFTLNFLNHPFNIDLMPVELGSFDIIIGMDWLEKYQSVIVCAEKIVHIPWGNETLIVHGDGSNKGNETRLCCSRKVGSTTLNNKVIVTLMQTSSAGASLSLSSGNLSSLAVGK
nr:hypothetical protein [Tanacetum cinerariifolium]